jgi:hypothetical protein
MNHQDGGPRPAEVDMFSHPELMLRMRDTFDWPVGETYAPVARWKSPKAEFFRFVGSESGEMIVKAGTNWDSGHPAFLYQELFRLREIMNGLEVTVPAPLGWLDDPRLLVMKPITGDKLVNRVIPDRNHPAWRSGVEGLLQIITKCAQVLAVFHSDQPAPEHPDVEMEVKTDLRRAARRALVSPRLAQGRFEELSVARGFRFSANDFLVDGERLVLVDPPHLIRYDVVQRDLSAFTFEVYRALRMHRSGGENADLAELIRSTFIASYVEASGRNARVDRWALQFYEVSRIGGMLYNLTRNRELALLARGVGWGVAHRLPLGVRGGALPSRSHPFDHNIHRR